MSHRKQRSAFDQVSEFDRGRIVAYRNSGLSFRQIGGVGRNQTTVLRISERWMLDVGRIHLMAPLHTSYASVCNTMMVGLLSGDTVERMLNSCIMHYHTGPAPGIIVWGGIGYHCRTRLIRIAGTLNSQRYISEVLEPFVLPYLQGLATAIFQQNNARPHVLRLLQRFFVNQQIELLPWSTHSPDLSLTENMWSMVAQRLSQITAPAATPDHLWQRVEAAWSAVPPRTHPKSL
ncbi:transposable element Tcb1 transposase [Trichonephila clavipes]|nr:transposable element Tcb1 transposase [Trichonephila clavipes]